MQADFHYYATYCAAYLAGYSHEEALALCYSDQFVDCCTKTFLKSINATVHAATSQSQAELVDLRSDILSIQEITRIWASFHFLPKDLFAKVPHSTKTYRNKYRLICGPNGPLVKDTVELAKGRSIQAAGIAMHVLSDTWAHMNYAGTPTLAINYTGDNFYEFLPTGQMRKLSWKHTPGATDDIGKGVFNATVFNTSEYNILNLGHGHSGHLPDYSFMKYKYMPAWDNYREFLKDNPSDYRKAFCQMVYALRYLRGDIPSFELDTYDEATVDPYMGKIILILTRRHMDASADWNRLAKELSGHKLPDFDISTYVEEYKKASAEEKDYTFLGKFILAALSQKSMVTNKIYTSGNLIAGISIDYSTSGFAGIKDYLMLVKESVKNANE